MNSRNISILQRIRYSVRRIGVRATVLNYLKMIFLNLYTLIIDPLFDIKYGIDTYRWSQLAKLTIKSDNRERGVLYQPTKVVPLRKMFNAIKLIIPEDSVFVDFGCGKGRVLLIASELGFREVRGLEFAQELCEIARKNCAIYKIKKRLNTEYRIIDCDVTNYEIKIDENVFFLYNPFDETILTKVLSNIVASLQAKHRKILIIYNNPLYANIFEKQNEFVRLQEFNFWFNKFIVYSNRN